MIRWLAWLWRTRNCQHPNVRGIYGDEIIHSGGRRWRCLDCGKAFNRDDQPSPGQVMDRD